VWWIHRHEDFKPHNILLASPLRPGQPDVVKLVDFGLSKELLRDRLIG
jgi:serine/threonine protein kinase